MRKLKVLLFLVLSLVLVVATTEAFRALHDSSKETRVYDSIDVTDGDTFKFSNSSISINVGTIRLLGVDTPERDEAHFDDASEYLRSVLRDERRNFWIEVLDPADTSLTFKRLLALVYLDADHEESINEMVLRYGWGIIYKFPGDLKDDESLRTRFFKAQISAALAGRGIWQGKKGVFVAAILYWGHEEKVAIVNSGDESISLDALILRDENLEKKYREGSSKPCNLFADESWQASDSVVAPGKVVYVYKQKSKVWNDAGDTAFLYYANGTMADKYTYKGPS